MNEDQAVKIYREITGASEALAKSVFMFMDIRRDLARRAEGKGLPSPSTRAPTRVHGTQSPH